MYKPADIIIIVSAGDKMFHVSTVSACVLEASTFSFTLASKLFVM